MSKVIQIVVQSRLLNPIKIIIESVRKELYTTKEWEEFKKDIIAALGEN